MTERKQLIKEVKPGMFSFPRLTNDPSVANRIKLLILASELFPHLSNEELSSRVSSILAPKTQTRP